MSMQVAAWQRSSAELSAITELIGYSAKILNQLTTYLHIM